MPIHQALHRFLTVCTGCKLCRPTETYVHVGFVSRCREWGREKQTEARAGESEPAAT